MVTQNETLHNNHSLFLSYFDPLLDSTVETDRKQVEREKQPKSSSLGIENVTLASHHCNVTDNENEPTDLHHEE